jgi:hypothetical protein
VVPEADVVVEPLIECPELEGRVVDSRGVPLVLGVLEPGWRQESDAVVRLVVRQPGGVLAVEDGDQADGLLVPGDHLIKPLGRESRVVQRGRDGRPARGPVGRGVRLARRRELLVVDLHRSGAVHPGVS